MFKRKIAIKPAKMRLKRSDASAIIFLLFIGERWQLFGNSAAAFGNDGGKGHTNKTRSQCASVLFVRQMLSLARTVVTTAAHASARARRLAAQFKFRRLPASRPPACVCLGEPQRRAAKREFSALRRTLPQSAGGRWRPMFS